MLKVKRRGEEKQKTGKIYFNGQINTFKNTVKLLCDLELSQSYKSVIY